MPFNLSLPGALNHKLILSVINSTKNEIAISNTLGLGSGICSNIVSQFHFGIFGIKSDIGKSKENS